MLVNADRGELRVTIKDHFTRLPYVDAVGHTTSNMKVDMVSGHDPMYEPRNHQLGQCKITFPTLIGRDNYRALYQQIKDGARVEIYNFQPDCGDPIFAGFVVPNGRTEADGKLMIEVRDSLEQGKWQRLQLIEEGDQLMSDWYDRALSHWIDIANEDFSTSTSAIYDVLNDTHACTLDWAEGALTARAGGDDGLAYRSQISAKLAAIPAFTPAPGDSYMIDLYATFSTDGRIVDLGGVNAKEYARLWFGLSDHGSLLHNYNTNPNKSSFLAEWAYYNIVGFPEPVYRYVLNSTTLVAQDQANVDAINFHQAGAGPADFTSDYFIEQMPATHRLTMLLRFGENSLTQNLAVDGQIVQSLTGNWNYAGNTSVVPSIEFYVAGLGSSVILQRFRVRKLTPYIRKSGHFVPQNTTTPIYFQPNQEDLVSFLEFLAENDNTEFKVIYKPDFDEIELDAVNALGENASAHLDYSDYPGGLVVPMGVGTDEGDFQWTPPFRFEEGFNLSATPIKESSQIPHANEVNKLGSGQVASQLQADVWSQQEVGNPAAGIAPVYPTFESVSSDSRAAVLSIVQGLAEDELARGVDDTPSLTLEIMDDVRHAFRWKTGDIAWVKTRSLVRNVDQLMRIMDVEWNGGSPVKKVTVGRHTFDPSMQRILAKNMLMDWLYDQNAQFGTTLIYPVVPSTLASFAASPVWQMPLDQFTTGAAIISAELRWFSNEGDLVSDLQANINGAAVRTSKSGTDSGSINIMGLISQPQMYNLSFLNIGADPVTLASAFLTVRLRI